MSVDALAFVAVGLLSTLAFLAYHDPEFSRNIRRFLSGSVGRGVWMLHVEFSTKLLSVGIGGLLLLLLLELSGCGIVFGGPFEGIIVVWLFCGFPLFMLGAAVSSLVFLFVRPRAQFAVEFLLASAALAGLFLAHPHV